MEKLVWSKCGTKDVVESILIYANSALSYKLGLYYKFYDKTDNTNTDIWCPDCKHDDIVSEEEYKKSQMKKVSKEADAAMKRYTKKLKKEAKKWEKSKDI